ncbi:phosphatase PAP2 family protein [soil metagenome]
MPFIYKKNALFFSGFLFFVSLSILLLLFYSKSESFLLLNSYHTQSLTYFFISVTYLGDGLFVIIVGLVLFFLRRRLAGVLIIASYLLSGGIVQLIKYFVIEPRPGIFFKDSGYPYFIDNVTLHSMHAFPSGHTASAFALATILSLWVKNKWWSLVFLVLAILAGYSRIYLAQHFLQDVLAGAVIGVTFAIISYLLAERINENFIL